MRHSVRGMKTKSTPVPPTESNSGSSSKTSAGTPFSCCRDSSTTSAHGFPASSRFTEKKRRKLLVTKRLISSSLIRSKYITIGVHFVVLLTFLICYLRTCAPCGNVNNRLPLLILPPLPPLAAARNTCCCTTEALISLSPSPCPCLQTAAEDKEVAREVAATAITATVAASAVGAPAAIVATASAATPLSVTAATRVSITTALAGGMHDFALSLKKRGNCTKEATGMITPQPSVKPPDAIIRGSAGTAAAAGVITPSLYIRCPAVSQQQQKSGTSSAIRRVAAALRQSHTHATLEYESKATPAVDDKLIVGATARAGGAVGAKTGTRIAAVPLRSERISWSCRSSLEAPTHERREHEEEKPFSESTFLLYLNALRNVLYAASLTAAAAVVVLAGRTGTVTAADRRCCREPVTNEQRPLRGGRDTSGNRKVAAKVWPKPGAGPAAALTAAALVAGIYLFPYVRGVGAAATLSAEAAAATTRGFRCFPFFHSSSCYTSRTSPRLLHYLLPCSSFPTFVPSRKRYHTVALKENAAAATASPRVAATSPAAPTTSPSPAAAAAASNVEPLMSVVATVKNSLKSLIFSPSFAGTTATAHPVSTASGAAAAPITTTDTVALDVTRDNIASPTSNTVAAATTRTATNPDAASNSNTVGAPAAAAAIFKASDRSEELLSILHGSSFFARRRATPWLRQRLGEQIALNQRRRGSSNSSYNSNSSNRQSEVPESESEVPVSSRVQVESTAAVTDSKTNKSSYGSTTKQNTSGYDVSSRKKGISSHSCRSEKEHDGNFTSSKAENISSYSIPIKKANVSSYLSLTGKNIRSSISSHGNKASITTSDRNTENTDTEEQRITPQALNLEDVDISPTLEDTAGELTQAKTAATRAAAIRAAATRAAATRAAASAGGATPTASKAAATPEEQLLERRHYYGLSSSAVSAHGTEPQQQQQRQQEDETQEQPLQKLLGSQVQKIEERLSEEQHPEEKHEEEERGEEQVNEEGEKAGKEKEGKEDGKKDIGTGAAPLLSGIMAWRCTGRSNDELVEHLRDAGVITSPRVYEAMKAVDRGNFIDSCAYMDSPQPLGIGSATISAPHMHAAALEELIDHLQPGNRVLDVGSGSGYLTVVMAYIVGVKGIKKEKATTSQQQQQAEPEGVAVGIDYVPGLVKYSRERVKRAYPTLLSNDHFVLAEEDGWKGYPSAGPYDAIHVGAAAATIPKHLLQQLKNGGKMVLPVEESLDGEILFEEAEDEEGKGGEENATQSTGGRRSRTTAVGRSEREGTGRDEEEEERHRISTNALWRRLLMGGGGQRFVAVTKDLDGKVHVKKLMGVMYVPLVKRKEPFSTTSSK